LYEHGFSPGTWNYFEAGHGKGAPDGVGGALKRSADAVVSSGADVPDASNFYGLLADKTSIKLYFCSRIECSRGVSGCSQWHTFSFWYNDNSSAGDSQAR